MNEINKHISMVIHLVRPHQDREPLQTQWSHKAWRTQSTKKPIFLLLSCFYLFLNPFTLPQSMSFRWVSYMWINVSVSQQLL